MAEAGSADLKQGDWVRWIWRKPNHIRVGRVVLLEDQRAWVRYADDWMWVDREKLEKTHAPQ